MAISIDLDGKIAGLIMDEIEKMASSQLMTIEIVHDVKFKNKDEIARMIAGSITDKRKVLMVTTAINLWVAGSGITGETEIPEKMVANIIRDIGIKI